MGHARADQRRARASWRCPSCEEPISPLWDPPRSVHARMVSPSARPRSTSPEFSVQSVTLHTSLGDLKVRYCRLLLPPLSVLTCAPTSEHRTVRVVLRGSPKNSRGNARPITSADLALFAGQYLMLHPLELPCAMRLGILRQLCLAPQHKGLHDPDRRSLRLWKRRAEHLGQAFPG